MKFTQIFTLGLALANGLTASVATAQSKVPVSPAPRLDHSIEAEQLYAMLATEHWMWRQASLRTTVPLDSVERMITEDPNRIWSCQAVYHPSTTRSTDFYPIVFGDSRFPEHHGGSSTWNLTLEEAKGTNLSIHLRNSRTYSWTEKLLSGDGGSPWAGRVEILAPTSPAMRGKLLITRRGDSDEPPSRRNGFNLEQSVREYVRRRAEANREFGADVDRQTNEILQDMLDNSIPDILRELIGNGHDACDQYDYMVCSPAAAGV